MIGQLNNNSMSELTLEQRIDFALTIAEAYGLEDEVNECMKQGMTPEEALEEWDL